MDQESVTTDKGKALLAKLREQNKPHVRYLGTIEFGGAFRFGSRSYRTYQDSRV